MVVKITQGISSRGMLAYNDRKLKKGEASILGYNKVATDGQPIEAVEVAELTRQFEQRAALNRGTGKKFIHISLNPNPDEQLSDELLATLAKDYMKQLGYASQPYLIYKHTDISRTHLHVVSCNIKANGSRVADSNLLRRSNEIRQELEDKYQLLKGKSQRANSLAAKAPDRLDYSRSGARSQLRSICLKAIETLRFACLEDYSAYLKTLGVAVRRTDDAKGRPLGLTYQPAGTDGALLGMALKASRLAPDGRLGLVALEKTFLSHREAQKALLPEFKERLANGLKKGVEGLSASGIVPVGSQDRPKGFWDTQTGHYYSADALTSSNPLSADQMASKEASPTGSSHRPEPSPDTTFEDATEGSPNAGFSAALLGGLGQMGGDSYAPDNDKNLRKKRRKRGI